MLDSVGQPQTLSQFITIEQERTSTIVQDKVKEKIERQNSEKLCRKLDTKDVVGKVIKDMQNQKQIVVLKNLYVGNLKQRMRLKSIPSIL